MDTEEAEHIGLCTICQTVHFNGEGYRCATECMNCKEVAVLSLTAISDIVNDYKRLQQDYDKLVEEGMSLDEYD